MVVNNKVCVLIIKELSSCLCYDTKDVDASPRKIECMFSNCKSYIKVLTDLGAAHSFVSSVFDTLDVPLCLLLLVMMCLLHWVTPDR